MQVACRTGKQCGMNTPKTLDLTAVGAMNVADLKAALDGLSAEQLADLHALEAGREGGPRTTALDAIVGELDRARGLGDEAAGVALDVIAASGSEGARAALDKAAADKAAADKAAADKAAAEKAAADKAASEKAAADKAAADKAAADKAAADKAAATDETPKWQHPDYTGPLTGDQATWRHRHLKPVNVVRTK